MVVRQVYDFPDSTIKKYLIVQQEGISHVFRMVDHYKMIIAVGFKINNERAVQFR